MSIDKKGQKDDPRSNRLVSLTLVLGKVMEVIILSAITQHIQDNHGIKPSQHGFMKGRPFFSLLFLQYLSQHPGQHFQLRYSFYTDFEEAVVGQKETVKRGNYLSYPEECGDNFLYDLLQCQIPCTPETFQRKKN